MSRWQAVRQYTIAVELAKRLIEAHPESQALRQSMESYAQRLAQLEELRASLGSNPAVSSFEVFYNELDEAPQPPVDKEAEMEQSRLWAAAAVEARHRIALRWP